MLNDIDDDNNKYDSHEESEYHFSEDDASYEIETETPTPSNPQPSEPKPSLKDRLASSKRFLISGGVFVGLIFIVYKMIAPSSVPSTDITPPSLAQQTTMPKPAATPVAQKAPGALPTAVNPDNTLPVAPVVTTAATTMPAPTMTAPAVVNTQPLVPPQEVNSSNPSMYTGMPANAMAPVMQTAPVAQQQVATAPMAVTPTGTDQTTGMPAIIPVQSNVTQTTSAPAAPQVVSEADNASLQESNDKLLDDIKAEYSQKLTEYQAQNKALQSQVDTLNTKIANMEAQMGDLAKALNHAQATAAAATVEPGGSDYRGISGNFNVQAIIPGRAWLKSDAGDTITVAEGDVVRGLGKVSKIDPYDGVVVINTGSKTISLSYGNGA